MVVAENAEDVAAAVRIAHQHQRSVTFRSGGTSLSGQSVSDGIIVDTRQHFRGVEVLDGGKRVRCSPGATVRQVNARLALYRRILGPDPASESACTIGGVVANNSSGMSCGTTANTYQTLDSLRFVLVTGTMVDTSRADCDSALRAAEPELWRTLSELRDRVRSNPAVRGAHPSPVLHEEHHGLRTELPAGPRRTGPDPGPPHDRIRGHAGVHPRRHVRDAADPRTPGHVPLHLRHTGGCHGRASRSG